MCGIVGAVANTKKNIIPVLLEGLKRLEYRGYDSAGIGILDNEDEFLRIRTIDKIEALEKKIKQNTAYLGIAHTRWATHGKPSEENAHPHIVGDIMVVHNGIIENYIEIKAELLKKGYTFKTDTDTEVIAYLINENLDHDEDMLKNLNRLQKQIRGAYALLVMHRHHQDKFWAIRQGAPLVAGIGTDENFVASDILSLLPSTRKFMYLEDGDCLEVTKDQIKVVDVQGKVVKHKIEELDMKDDIASKGQFKYFMQKEIFEQPEIISDIVTRYLADPKSLLESFGKKAKKSFSKTKRVKIVACGTSFNAGMVAKYWIESLCKIPCDVEIASEYRYRKTIVEPKTLFIVISQSGETADTLAALRLAKTQNYLATLAICNVETSSIMREANLKFAMHAGAEIGVASTKAFTAQLLALYLLTYVLTKLKKQKIDDLNILASLPASMNEVLKLDDLIKKMAQDFEDKKDALFLGRGVSYPIAQEGALKLKEISYIHAEAYAAGELKHGPIALIDDHMPVIVLMPYDHLTEKVKNAIEEVAARDGKVYVFADERISMQQHLTGKVINMPKIFEVLSPILYVLPLQLLSYHVAVLRGNDVDKPRNLAKSVTVE